MFRKLLITFLTAAALLIIAPSAGADPGNQGKGPPEFTLDHPGMQRARAAQEAVTGELMAQAAIIGTAVTVAEENSEPAILVLVDTNHRDMAKTIAELAPIMHGVRVLVQVTERIVPMPAKRPAGKPVKPAPVSHTALQDPPIQLGTSGGWRDDLANGYCCGGTLGALIQIGTTQYILSNYHVLESDIVLGGNNLTAQTGQAVIQPGLIDVGCKVEDAQDVATLYVQGSLPDANVDAAIAQVIDGRVGGSILEIGTISSQTVDAAVKQAVKKSGRTTGLTRSTISGLNATVSVTYDNECAGDTAFTKTFTRQIVIANRRSAFLAAGDSGSLLVEDTATNPRAIGLLFAGSNTIAVANPIDDVLSFFDPDGPGPKEATMVGQ